MAYFLGGAISAAASYGVNEVLHRREMARQRHAFAMWNSPLSRLGRCGIDSLRTSKAVGETMSAIGGAVVRGWRYNDGVSLAGSRIAERILLFGPHAAAVIDVILHDDHVEAVRQVDESAQLLTAHLHVPAVGFACRANASDEPRVLPGQSGQPVTVTGLPWLPGLLRSRLGDGEEPSCLPDHFEPAWQGGHWTGKQMTDCYWGVLSELPDWWSIRDLRLDDGYSETMDLVCAGPTAVLAIEISNMDPDVSAVRVSRHTHRLRAYMPQADVIPVVVTDSVADMEFGPQVDTTGSPVAWIKPERLYEFARQVSRRGLSQPEITFLNAPAPGWYRRVGFGPDGPSLTWGWSES